MFYGSAGSAAGLSLGPSGRGPVQGSRIASPWPTACILLATAESVKKNVAPHPDPSDSTQIRPPCRATIVLHRASPRPVPGVSVPCRRFSG
jgi:hypothetical protein